MPNSFVTDILSFVSLITLIAVLFYTILFLIARKKIEGLTFQIGKHSLLLSFLVSMAGVIGSLVYSEVFKYEPCTLCWVQRIFIYPQAVIFFLALWRKDYRMWFYTLPLTVMGGVVAWYHAYTQIWGGSLLPCVAAGGDCSKVFFIEYGFITIPAMAAVSFSVLVFLNLHMKYFSSKQQI